MDQFIVSARKYRPTRFDEVVGQAHIADTLKNAIKTNQLAHAFLFCGPRGVGKTTCARLLAKTINCENIGADFEACNECSSCKSFNNSSSFNIFEVDGASNSKVDEMRELIDQVRYAPQSGKYKIYIIDEVHMLSANAFNAFLKTLEEPPSYVKFVLATTEKHKILPTILSRCQIFDFYRIGVEDIIGLLKKVAEKEEIPAEEEALHVIAQKADGALRDALSMFDRLVSFGRGELTYQSVLENLNILDQDYFFKITDCLLAQDIPATMLLFDEILARGFEANHVLSGLGAHFRDLLMCKDVNTVKLLEVADKQKERFYYQAKAAPVSFLLNSLNIANQSEQTYKFSQNQRLHVELALMKLCYLSDMVEVMADDSPQPVPKKKLNTQPPYSDQAPIPKTPAVAEHPVENIPVPTVKEVPLEPVSTVKEPTPDKAEPPEKKEPAANGSSMFGAKIRDIADMKVSQVAEVPQEEKSDDQPLEKTEEPAEVNITPDQLNAAWQAYRNALEEAGRMALYNYMGLIVPELEAHIIKVGVDGKLQHEAFKNEKSKLIEFIRDKVKCSSLQLELTEVESTTPKSKKAFTSTEKFAEMVVKNPAVQKLKDQLDLEFEF